MPHLKGEIVEREPYKDLAENENDAYFLEKSPDHSRNWSYKVNK